MNQWGQGGKQCLHGACVANGSPDRSYLLSREGVWLGKGKISLWGMLWNSGGRWRARTWPGHGDLAKAGLVGKAIQGASAGRSVAGPGGGQGGKVNWGRLAGPSNGAAGRRIRWSVWLEVGNLKSLGKCKELNWSGLGTTVLEPKSKDR